jgi:TP901 family phage tail tape measure protein
MKEVQTISNAVANDFKGMSSEIVSLSKELPDSANGLTKALYQVVSAGYDGAEGMQVLEVAAKGAVAGVTDTLTAVDGLTTILNAFHMEAADAAKVSDILFTTIRLGKTTLPELAHSFSLVAPLAAATGIEFEEVAAAVATLTKQGTPTAEAMTQIRSAILSMGQVLGESWAETMTLQEGMIALRNASDSSDKSLRDLVGRVEAVNAVLGTTGENAAMAASDLEAHTKSLGAAAEAYRVMAETGTNQIRILVNNVMAKLKPLGDFVLGVTTGVAKALNFMLGETETHLEKLKRTNESLVQIYQQEASAIKQLVAQLQSAERGTDEYATLEKQLAAYLGDTAMNALLAGDNIDLLNIAKERGIELDERILETRRNLLGAQIEASILDKKLFDLKKSQMDDNIEELKKKRDEVEKRVRQGIIDDIWRNSPDTINGKASYELDVAYEQGFPEQKELIDKQVEASLEMQEIELKLAQLRQQRVLDEAKINFTLEKQQALLKGMIEGTEEKPTTPSAAPADTFDAENNARLFKEQKFGEAVIAETERQEKEKEEARQESLRRDLENQKWWHEEQIALLEAQKEEWKDHAGIIEQIDDQILEHKRKAGIIERKNNQKLLSEILQDTRKMSLDELKIYREDLNKKADAITDNAELQKSVYEEVADVQDEIFNREIRRIEDVSDALNDLADFVGNFDSKLSDSVRSAASLVRSVSDLTKSIGTGNVAGVAGASFSIFSSIAGLLQKEQETASEKYASSMEAVNRSLSQQINLLRRLNGQAELSGIVDLVNSLNESIDKSFNQIGDMVVYEDGKKYKQKYIKDFGDLTKEQLEKILKTGVFSINHAMYYLTDSTRNAIRAALDDIYEAEEKIFQYDKEYRELITGTTTESIADSIADGFSRGLDSAEVFADTFEGLMRQALENTFKREMISKYLDPWYEKFYTFAEDGLTAGEITTLDFMFSQIVKDAESLYESFDKWLDVYNAGENGDTPASLAGAISGITEETAGLLEGQFRAVKINTAETNIHMQDMVGIMDDLLLINSQIADNTKAGTRSLQNIERTIATQGRANTSMRATGV